MALKAAARPCAAALALKAAARPCAATGPVALAAALAFLPAVARAQPSPSDADRAEAVRRFQTGLRAYDEQRFDAALVEFRKAYALAPTYKLLYNIGQVCVRAFDDPCVVRAFEAYLAEGGDSVPGPRRDAVRAELERVGPRVARLEVTSNVEGATVAIDGVVIGATPARGILVPAGRRTVHVSREGLLPETRVVDAAGADPLVLRFDLLAPTAAPPVAAPTPALPVIARPLPGDADVPRPSRFTTLSWIGLGASAALLAGAATAGGLALNARNEFRDAHFEGPDAEARGRNARQNVLNLGLASDLLFVAAGATLGTTLVGTFLFRHEAGATPRVAFEPAARRLVLTASCTW